MSASPPPSSSHSTAGHIINPTSPAARQVPNHTYLGEGKSLWEGGGDSGRSGIIICAVVQFGQHQHLTLLGLDGERPVSGFVKSISVKVPRTVGHPTSLGR